jgi:outer membrane biosynthesis protein TonB
MWQHFLDFIGSPAFLDYLNRNWYNVFWVIAVVCFTLLGREIDRQDKAKKRKVHYQRVPVVHPKRNAAPKPPLPMSTRLLISETQRQQKEKPKSTPAPPPTPQPTPAPPPAPIPAPAPLFTPPAPPSPTPVPQPPKPVIPDVAPVFKRRTHPLEAKLVKLLNGDRAAADRLLQSARLRHPDRSEQWIVEKCIHDLERDRF